MKLKCITTLVSVILMLSLPVAAKKRKKQDEPKTTIEPYRLQALEERMEDIVNRLMLIEDRLDTIKTRVDGKNTESQEEVPLDVSSKKEQGNKRPGKKLSKSGSENFLGVGKLNIKQDKLRLTNTDLKRSASKSKSRSKKRSSSSSPLTIKSSNTNQLKGRDKQAIEVYNQAYTQFQQGDLKRSEQLFGSFLKAYPKHTYSDNAYFWLGEISYQRKQYGKAISHYDQVINRYPNENKVPAAMYKKIVCLMKKSESEKAKNLMAHLKKRYPDSLYTKKAEQKF